jgi:hypothetical protein
MKIVIKDIKNIEQGREIGQTLFIRANSKQIENMSKVINSITELVYFDLKSDTKKKKK